MFKASVWIEKYFSVQVFFIIFRETVETVIIVSVLLAFLNRGFGEKALHENHIIDDEGRPLNTPEQNDDNDDEHSVVDESTSLTAVRPTSNAATSSSISSSTATTATTPTIYNDIQEDNNQISTTSKALYRRLVIQVWVGAFLGLVVCLFIGSFFVFAFYHLGKDLWGATEKMWEAVFSIVASLIITFMGAAMLRINKMKEKWRVKLAKAIIETHEGKGSWGVKYLSRKYAMGILPFVTTLREGLEAVVFLGGLGVNQPASSFPLPTISAIALGSLLGWLMYRTGDHMSIQYFLVGSTCFLYLVAAGLMSRGVWYWELQNFINHVGSDVSEMGSGPGSYDITRSVWHVNCCNPDTDGGWMIFNALLGWQNSATKLSVLSYNLYWVFVIGFFYTRWHRETTGYFPLIPRKYQKQGFKKLNYTPEEARRIMNKATYLYTQGGEGSLPNEDQSLGDYPTGASSAGGRPRNSHDSQTSQTPLIVR
ncbi:uncharacterized protein SAPINGB_P005905 [Magnusiomyces paraingens]|uniref:Iron permease FTR1 n=1 Tax=Magnusiomyces paraingens TaxID=2606893 RepID=A0A5E8C1U1_9ASCO|nr:uncharacterized protein SAPINGB_P005905 [Saprochaete ingens]VVT57859.1 unnamed protein product [Saprochaete ingens]